MTARTPEETNMSPTIRSLVIPVSDLDAAKAVYTALLGAPHTDQPYYVGYNVDGFEVSLAPGRRGRWTGGLRRRRGSRRDPAPCSRLVRPSAAPRVKSHPRRGCACSPTPTATRSGCAAGSRRCGRRRTRAGPRHHDRYPFVGPSRSSRVQFWPTRSCPKLWCGSSSVRTKPKAS